MPTVLLAATTSALASNYVQTSGMREVIQFTCPGIGAAETGTLQKVDSTGTWRDHYENGNLVQVTDTNSGVVVYGPGTYRINKSATAGSVAVEVSTNRSP